MKQLLSTDIGSHVDSKEMHQTTCNLGITVNKLRFIESQSKIKKIKHLLF